MPEENGQPILSLGRRLCDLETNTENDPKELLKDRFLCREGILGLYGQTGIGKSSFSMQCKILWSLGREAFGIVPRQPLKSLLIQAENDDGDIAEMRDGVCDGLELSPEVKLKACENIIVIQEDSKYGSDFIEKTVKPALELHKPDLLWIDCALSYMGGDTISQEIVGGFLRNDLKPLLKIHQCGCVLVHHVNKNGNSDNAYAGSGSAEFGNMPRAILVLVKDGKNFKLVAAKRGTRLRWTMPDGETQILERRVKHSSIPGIICWEDVGADDLNDKNDGTTQEHDREKILNRMPNEGTISQKDLSKKVNQETKLGINKIKDLIKSMIESKAIFVVKRPRSTGCAEIHYSRTPDHKQESINQLLAQIDGKPEIKKDVVS